MSSAVSPLASTVEQLAAAHRLDVTVADQPGPGHGAQVTVRRRRSTITVSAAMLREPAAVQEFAAAHEVAHVALHHAAWRRVWPGGAWTLAMTAAQLGLLWLALTGNATGGLAVAIMVLGALVPLVTGAGAWALFAARSRRCEIAADRLALTWGYTLAGSENALLQGENRLTTHRLYRPFRMHPLPHHRAAAGGSQGSAAKENHHDRPDPP